LPVNFDRAKTEFVNVTGTVGAIVEEPAELSVRPKYFERQVGQTE
jgi:hypothetical protein